LLEVGLSCPKLSRSCLEIVRSWTKRPDCAWKLFQSCSNVVPKKPGNGKMLETVKGCSKVAPKLCQSCSKLVPQLLEVVQTCLKQLRQSCSKVVKTGVVRRCPEVVGPCSEVVPFRSCAEVVRTLSEVVPKLSEVVPKLCRCSKNDPRQNYV